MSLVREAFATGEGGLDLRSGWAGAVATAAPVALGVAASSRTAGLTAAIGGLNAALAVPRAGVRPQLWWGGLYVLGGCGAVALAALVGGTAWLLALVTLAWVGATTLLRGAGQAGILTGFSLGAVLVVLGGVPSSGVPLGDRVLWFAAGAGAGVALMVAARRGPATRELSGSAARELSGSATGERVVRPSLDAIREAVKRDPLLRAHALRLALAVSLGTVIERALSMPHGYWVPVTVLAILQPGEHATQVRVVQRAAGTLVGAIAVIVITLVTSDDWVLVAGSAVAAFGIFALDPRAYFWLVVMITPTALLLLSVSEFQGIHVAVQRTLDSTLGIVVGLVLGEISWRLGPRPGHRGSRA